MIRKRNFDHIVGFVIGSDRREVDVIEVVLFRETGETELFQALRSQHAIHLKSGLVLEIFDCLRGRRAKNAIDFDGVAITFGNKPVIQGGLNQFNFFRIPLEIGRETCDVDTLGDSVQSVPFSGKGVDSVGGQVGESRLASGEAVEIFGRFVLVFGEEGVAPVFRGGGGEERENGQDGKENGEKTRRLHKKTPFLICSLTRSQGTKSEALYLQTYYGFIIAQTG